MPRDGSGIFTQPFPDVAPDTTIESAVYNGFVADVATDLNTPRPVIAGGTGANNALDAMITLGGEIAEQLVTNYDSFPFETGSFRSAGSATAGPVDGHAFVGIVYRSDDNNLVLEARDQNDTAVPGTKYIREKKAGVWSAWEAETADIAADVDAAQATADAALAAAIAAQTTADAKVAKAGDTMTGALVLPGNAASALQAVPLQQLTTYAAPFDALASEGMQINGGMEVSQERGETQTSTHADAICDGWRVFRDGTMAFLAGTTASAPIATGITNTLYLVVTTGQPSLSGTDNLVIQQTIEGYRVSRLAWGTANAQSLTIGFWSQHHRAGVYSVVVFNHDGSRTYSATYTHAAADVSQYNTITIPGCTDGRMEER